jgi:FKBP-type peptidyl-prolyl cis-trans isomerase FklB
MKIVAMVSLILLSMNAYAVEDKRAQLGVNETTAVLSKPMLTGEAFLAANRNKPGVVTRPDGLQYKVMTMGKGKKPTSHDTVTVHYVGRLVDGTIFDSSYQRGQPATFSVNGVIAGWREALQLMPVGSTWELYIPAALAYGKQGAPPLIGPDEVLIFQVNLRAIH